MKRELPPAEHWAEHSGNTDYLASASNESAGLTPPARATGSFDGAADASTATGAAISTTADDSACATGDAGNRSRSLPQQTTSASPKPSTAGPTVADQRSIS